VGGEHRLAHAHQAGAEVIGTDALRGDARALEQQAVANGLTQAHTLVGTPVAA